MCTVSPDEECLFELSTIQQSYCRPVQWLVDQKPSSRTLYVGHSKRGLFLSIIPELNPYMYGFVSSTDTHLGTPGLVDERCLLDTGERAKSSSEGLVDKSLF